MGACIQYDYADDIKNHRFEKVADLLRKGELSALDQTSLNLLADYLEGELRLPRGRKPHYDKFELAEYIYENVANLMRHGMTRGEAISELADREFMSGKNIERLLTIGKYFNELHAERDADAHEVMHTKETNRP